ncbi:prolyl oligopeptidase family serine peptidase [Pseudoduganella armeniaca]|uniref:S9 family peptidase n=1 Tax=Pseudoduganella armeniaca TaxID=2072590 RepID=A0A2R4CCL7_9BURK|nr:prolyl oligopeptidase family serine peptidase [Pseudoduganella armeniaca]AVR97383.1 S9 family peptidase [Pseudoduganella armeniaca]
MQSTTFRPPHRLAAALHASRPAASAEDPYLWLEEVDGDAALAWVGERNTVALAELQGDPGYPALRERLQTILDSKERIAYVRKHGQFLYNFWRDAEHVRGLWRRTTLEQYRAGTPQWETVIDLDALAQEEDENWVWQGVSSLYPDGNRCLISLSRGGGDAAVVREFDVATRRFVTEGFNLPEAKSALAWIDADTVFVSTDFGPGSMTASGYPRIVKQWRRGTPLAAAQTLFEAGPDDLGVGAYKDFTPGHSHQFISRQIDFYSSELFLRDGAALIKIDKPADANAYTVRDQLVVELRSAWTVDGGTYPQGALLAIGLRDFLAGGRQFDTLFQPTATSSLDGVAATRSTLLLNELDSVRNRLVELRHVDGAWQRRVVATPAFGTLEVAPLDDIASDQYFLTVNDFLHPTTLYLAETGSDTRLPLRALPGFFDADRLIVEQHHATSPDGTAVPYFVVRGRDIELDGSNPTVLYGYGGFEVSLKPFYSGVTGAAWLSQGGVYVLANIRGGGEFGPRWHQAALKAQRQRAFDDFIAVAEDVIARKLTSPRHLGIMGGSNGGLLVGAAMTQRPDLFGAVVCQVPLLDMRRYSKLLAGASWMGEYGDPDDPAQWDFIQRYSPYHNVQPGTRYPRVLFTTSTRDDRVHPGHARKMVARMQEQGHDVLYWENTEGGHAGAANNDQQARMWALTYTFLRRQLA